MAVPSELQNYRAKIAQANGDDFGSCSARMKEVIVVEHTKYLAWRHFKQRSGSLADGQNCAVLEKQAGLKKDKPRWT